MNYQFNFDGVGPAVPGRLLQRVEQTFNGPSLGLLAQSGPPATPGGGSTASSESGSTVPVSGPDFALYLCDTKHPVLPTYCHRIALVEGGKSQPMGFDVFPIGLIVAGAVIAVASFVGGRMARR